MICANGKMFLVMLTFLLTLKRNLPAALPEKHVCVDGKTRDVRTSGKPKQYPNITHKHKAAAREAGLSQKVSQSGRSGCFGLTFTSRH